MIMSAALKFYNRLRQRRSWPGGGGPGVRTPPPAPALTTRGIFANPMSFLGWVPPPPTNTSPGYPAMPTLPAV